MTYNAHAPTQIKKPLSYSKFDNIVDSDDEDAPTAAAPGQPPAGLDELTRSMPPHLYHKLTKAQMASASGDVAAAAQAAKELEEEMLKQPPAFREAFFKAQELRGASFEQKAAAMASPMLRTCVCCMACAAAASASACAAMNLGSESGPSVDGGARSGTAATRSSSALTSARARSAAKEPAGSVASRVAVRS